MHADSDEVSMAAIFCIRESRAGMKQSAVNKTENLGPTHAKPVLLNMFFCRFAPTITISLTLDLHMHQFILGLFEFKLSSIN